MSGTKTKEPTMKDIYRKLTKEEAKLLDSALEKMYTDGFAFGYGIAANERWILAERSLPATEEVVDVSVITADGKRKFAKTQFAGGRWKGVPEGTRVIAWRPESKPYDPELAI